MQTPSQPEKETGVIVLVRAVARTCQTKFAIAGMSTRTAGASSFPIGTGPLRAFGWMTV